MQNYESAVNIGTQQENIVCIPRRIHLLTAQAQTSDFVLAPEDQLPILRRSIRHKWHGLLNPKPHEKIIFLCLLHRAYRAKDHTISCQKVPMTSEFYRFGLSHVHMLPQAQGRIIRIYRSQAQGHNIQTIRHTAAPPKVRNF